MRKFIWLLLVFTIFSLSKAGVFYLQPEQCIYDAASNNTYCGTYKVYNHTELLNYGESYYNPNNGINITCKSFPMINEDVFLQPTEEKTYHDYNLTVHCADFKDKVVTLEVNETYNDSVRAIKVLCAPGEQSIKKVKKDLYPGEGWYHIKCLPPPKPISGVITLDDNATLGNNTFNIVSDWGTCKVTVDATKFLMSHVNFADEYYTCEKERTDCITKLSAKEAENKSYLYLFTIVLGMAAVGFIFWFKEYYNTGHLIGDLRSKLNKSNKNKEKEKSEKEDKEKPKKPLEYYYERYGLK